MSRHSVAGSKSSVLYPQIFAQASVALQVRAKLSIFHGLFAGIVEIDGMFSANNELFMVSAKRHQSEQHLINSFYSLLNIFLSMFLQQPKHVREALQSIQQRAPGGAQRLPLPAATSAAEAAGGDRV